VTFDEAARLAEKYGSPLLLYSRAALVRNYQAMRAALPGVELFYAAKANPEHSILSTLCELGSSVDVCSHREAIAALKAGFTPDRMIHTHPCKTPQNLCDCYAEGIRWFTFDCAGELPKLARYAPDANLLLRLAASSTSSMINLSAKFGAAPNQARDLLLEAKAAGLNVRGLSFHVGSQCLCPSDFENALVQARWVWDEAAAIGAPLEVLDIGGGFPAPYRTQVLTLESYCSSLASALDATFGDLPVRIIAEPGRGMCADTATLVTRVIGTNVRHGLPWYFIDDGLYGSFSGIVFDHADFPLLAANHDERPLHPCVVAGPTCDSGDVVTRDQLLPELQVGELLLVPSMGAYTAASASAFNGLDIARAIAVD
jgi:ornithine decarboxylase